MEIALLLFVAFISGVAAWLPCGVGLAAHRFALSGAVVRSKSKFILYLSRPPKSLSPLARLLFLLVMAVWCAVFFSLLGSTLFVAGRLGVAESHPVIPYALGLHFFVAALSLIAGHFLWRKVAYDF